MISADDIRHANILVVDDDADNLYMLSEVLSQAGYSRVSSTTESNQVCALHQENAFDLILLDMQMPGMSGLEVMEGLKKIEQEAYLPVLAITGDPSYKIAALEAGARDFVTKPYDLIEFQTRIRNMLEVRLLYKAVAEQGRLQKKMALHDPLTGLPNRRLLVDRMEKTMQHVSRNHCMMALMYIDLDGFKNINDQHGHQCGDELLKMVADRLLSTAREEDTVTRIGGDEFIMLLSEIDKVDDVVRPAAKVLRALSTPFDIDGLTVQVSGSIGISFYPTDGEDAESLIARADHALYEAKRAGKNRYRFTNLSAIVKIAM